METRKILFLCLFCMAISLNAYAGNGVLVKKPLHLMINCAMKAVGTDSISETPVKRLTGIIMEENGIPVSFASISLYSLEDSTFISGGISDEQGKFDISFPDRKAMAKFSCIGYKTTELPITAPDMGTVYMHSDTNMLGDVTVVGRRKQITRENGTLTLNVQDSNLKNIGKASDVMKYIPGMIFSNGKYEVFGKGEPVVYIDGRKVQTDSELTMLSSSDIKSAKLITNPGAEYDAGTRAVIAITTIRHSHNGLSGIVGTEVSRHRKWSGNGDVSLNMHKDALDVFVAYRYDNTRSDIRYDLDQTNYEEDTFHEISASEYSDRTRSHDYSLGMNYELSKNHTVGGKYTGNVSRYKLLDSPYDYMQTYKNGELLTYTDNNTDEQEKERFHNANIYYIGRLSENLRLNIDADYVYSRLTHTQTVTETSKIDATVENTNMENDQRNRAAAFKGVFSWDMAGNGSLAFGADFSKISSWGTSVNEEGKVDDSKYKNRETKYAGFITYSLAGTKWRGSVGVRYEYVHAVNTDYGNEKSKNDYSDILPSMSFYTSLGKVNIGVDFNSRVNRPSFRQLNNSVSYNNQYHYEQGNIDLKPQYVYDTELSVNYGIFDFKIDYQYIKDYIHPTAVSITGKPGTAAWMSTNAKKFRQVGAQFIAAPVFGCWRPILTAGVYKPDFALAFNGEETTYNHPYGMLSFQNGVELRGGWLFRGDFYWNIKGHHGIYEQNSYASFNMMAQKQLFNKKLTITLRAEDIFDWSGLKDVKKVNFIVQNRKVDNFNRCITATISYNFNSFKDKYNGSGSADDEINRF